MPRLSQEPDNRALYITLENMKEMALQAEFGIADADDSMKTVRRFVTDLWRETNRINCKEACNVRKASPTLNPYALSARRAACSVQCV